MTGVLGLDVSTASTGVALPTGRLLTWKPPSRLVPAKADPNTTAARNAWFVDRLTAVLITYDPDVAMFERVIAYPKRANATIPLAGLGAILRLVAWRHGVHVAEVTPSELKEWATGKGNASKDEMITAAGERGAAPQNHDEADAALLRFMAIEAGAR